MSTAALGRTGSVQTGLTPWPTELAERYRRLGYWKGVPIGAALAAAALRRPDHLALASGAESWTYRELVAAVDLLGARLLDAGLVRGDACVIQLPNEAEFVVLTLACLRIGVVPVMALAQHRRIDIEHLLLTTGAVAYASPVLHRGFDHRELVAEVAVAVPALRHVLVSGAERVWHGETDLSRHCRLVGDVATATAQVETDPPTADEIAVLLLSGGTTGRPKLIPRTHDDYVYNMELTAAASHTGPDSVYLAALPAGHNFTLGCPGILGTLLAGGTVVMAGSPSPDVVFPLVERHRVTHTAVVPAVAHRWAEAAPGSGADLSSLRVLAVGGSRLAAALGRRIEPALKVRLQQAFGMAEGLVNFTALDDPDQVRFETQGRPLSPADEIRIVDESGADVAEGAPGELITQGPYTIRGYYRAPETNRRCFTPQGWYRTGDVVRRVAGNLVVEGRTNDIINRGGEKISAEDVENLSYSHPDVASAAAVAAPDPVLGERVSLYVVPRGTAQPSLEEVRATMTAAGAGTHSLPEILVLVAELPTTNVGKIDKKALRADAALRAAENPTGKRP